MKREFGVIRRVGVTRHHSLHRLLETLGRLLKLLFDFLNVRLLFQVSCDESMAMYRRPQAAPFLRAAA